MIKGTGSFQFFNKCQIYIVFCTVFEKKAQRLAAKANTCNLFWSRMVRDNYYPVGSLNEVKHISGLFLSTKTQSPCILRKQKFLYCSIR